MSRGRATEDCMGIQFGAGGTICCQQSRLSAAEGTMRPHQAAGQCMQDSKES